MRPSRRTVAAAVVGALFALGGAALTMGRRVQRVSFDSVVEIWASLFRDVDRFGLNVTRISTAQEVALGRELTVNVTSYGPVADDPLRARYVSDVGNALLPYVERKRLPYSFTLLANTGINAFAIPGGRVYITRGMLDFVQSEAELAAIIGHEISHIDLRHCVERLQYALAVRHVAAIVDVAYSLLAIGYSKQQEIEADINGMLLAAKASYDPHAALVCEERMLAIEMSRERRPAPSGSMVGEIGGAAVESLESYFRTHPPSRQRALAIEQAIQRNAGRWRGEKFYVGAENLRLWKSRMRDAIPSEWRRFK